MPRPFISVIIVAHDRKQYVKRAVDSVLGQTLNRGLYEIIVVKNFRDKKIDSYVRKVGGKNIVTGNNPMGTDFALGIEASRGDVITFLEDDDLYHKQRLARVYEVFKSPDICYYRNTTVLVDSTGKEFMKQKRELAKPIIISSKSGEPPRNARAPVTSIAMKSGPIKKYLNAFREVYASIETFLFFVMYASNKLLYLDSERLSYHTLHSGSFSNPSYASMDEFRRKRAFLLEATLKSFEQTAKAIKDPKLERYVKDEALYDRAAINLLNDHDVYRLKASDYTGLMRVSGFMFLASIAHIILPKTVSAMFYRSELAASFKP